MNSRGKNACVAYATDARYLFPTLLSAMQAKQNVDAARTDVALCYIGEIDSAGDIVHEICDGLNIRFERVQTNVIEKLHICYARLFLDEILGSDYEKLLYIDGDTQISGNLQCLVDADIPTGAILAVKDPMTLLIGTGDRASEEFGNYFRSIGFEGQRIGDYFNSGVIGVNLRDLPEMKRDCIGLLKRNKGDYRFKDQDLLNLLLRDRRIPISFKWNFPVYFLNYRGVEEMIKPRIYHYMSNPRPWHGAFQPWGKYHSEKYAQMVQRFPQLLEFQPSIPAWLKYKYTAQQYYKMAFENLVRGRRSFVETLQNAEARAIV